MSNRLLFDPSQFFPAARRSPSAAASFASSFLQSLGSGLARKQAKQTRGPNLGNIGGPSATFQKKQVSTEKPKPPVQIPGVDKPEASVTKVAKPVREMQRAVRQRQPTGFGSQPPVAPEVFGGCGRRPDGSFG